MFHFLDLRKEPDLRRRGVQMKKQPVVGNLATCFRWAGASVGLSSAGFLPRRITSTSSPGRHTIAK